MQLCMVRFAFTCFKTNLTEGFFFCFQLIKRETHDLKSEQTGLISLLLKFEFISRTVSEIVAVRIEAICGSIFCNSFLTVKNHFRDDRWSRTGPGVRWRYCCEEVLTELDWTVRFQAKQLLFYLLCTSCIASIF